MYTQSGDQAEREQRLDELLASYLRAAEVGPAPDLEALLARNPDLAPELEAFLANEKRVDRLASPLRSIHRAAAPASQGQVVGNYEIIEEIAHGGMGVVYRARQRNLARVVALKMLRSGPLAAPAERHRFRAEAEAFAHLDHPAIVPIFEVGEQDDQLFFTMRLMEGGSLSGQVAGYRGQVRRAAHLLADVADAVHYAHQRGFLHRDLKPANILLDADGRPHVSDFGLVKRVAGHHEASSIELTQTGTVLGTPSYMAPEQASGSRDGITTAADVYSLGAILYELLTGRPPFRAETPLATLMLVRDQEPERPRRLSPGIDRDIETICLKCLEKDLRQRYASAGDLADELRRYVEGKPIVARPVGAFEAFTRWCRRRPLVATLAASFIVGFALVTWQWQRAQSNADRADANAHIADANALEAEQNAGRAEALALSEKEARERAEIHSARAHRAVNKFSTIFSERDLMFVPGMHDVRKELLEDALGYYQEFLKEHAGDPQFERDLADAQVRVGRIRDSVGSKTESLAAYLDARATYTNIVAANPTDRAMRRKLASVTMHVASLFETTGRPQEAMADFEKARAMYVALLEEDPANAETMHGLAMTLGNMALRYLKTGDVARARPACDQARTLREQLVKRHPGDSEYRDTLAGLYNTFGTLYEHERRPPIEGRDLFRKALAIREGLVKDHPQVTAYQRGLAEIHHNLGVQENRLNNLAAGREHFQRAFELHERLARENPKVTQFRRDLAGSHGNLGLDHLLARENEKGRDRFQKAREIQEKLLQDNPRVPGYRKDLARTYFQLGIAVSRLGNRAEALAHYERSRDIVRVLLQEDPSNLEYRERMAQTLNNLGLLLAKTGKVDEGRQALKTAIAHERFILEHVAKKDPGRIGMGNYLASLGEIERDAGNLATALDSNVERRKLSAGNADELFRVAGDFARLASAALKIPAAAPADADRYADLAVEALRECQAAGLKEFAGRVRKAKELEVLRARLDFQKLLESPGN